MESHQQSLLDMLLSNPLNDIIGNVANDISGSGAITSPVFQLLYDTFTDIDGTLITAHTPDVGSAAYRGNGTIVGNKLSDTAIYTMLQAPVQLSYVHELGLYAATQLFFRKVAWNAVWVARSSRTPSSLKVELRVDTGAGFVNVATDLTAAYVAGQEIKVLDDGAVIKIFVGGVLVITYASAIHAGGLDLQLQAPVSAAPFGIDDFEVL